MSAATVTTRKTKIEEEKIDVEAISSDEEETGHVHDERCGHAGPTRTIGRKERAARKEIAKVATLKALPHIKRVTFKRHNGPVFAVSNAEVYYDSTSGSYVVYGQPTIEQGGMGSQAVAAQRMAAEQAAAGMTDLSSSKVTVQDDDETEGGKDEDGEEEIDASGLDEKDISIVMDQAHVSRARAVKALRANGNDIVNTIMELTM